MNQPVFTATPEPEYTPSTNYRVLKGRGFRNDAQLIVALNVPDTRLPYNFADSLEDAEAKCTAAQGVGYSALPHGSTLGAVVVVYNHHSAISAPLGWHPLDNVPVCDDCVFMYRA